MRLADLTDRIMSASATLIAVVALGTGIYQAKLSRDQAKASVWPYLLAGNSGNNGYARMVQNVGLGPAVIQAFFVNVDGKPVHSWVEAAKALNIPLTFKGSRSTTFGPGIVVPVNSTIDLLELPDSADARLMHGSAARLTTFICYCSLYGDCWEVRESSNVPSKTTECRDDPARAFTR